MLKKRWLKQALFVLGLVALAPNIGAEDTYAWGGSGTAADPYQISTPQDLYTAFNTNSTYCTGNKYFELRADIDVDSVYSNWQPGCGSYSYFNGHFEGNGYTIKDLKVTNQGQMSGLFYDIYKSSAAFPTTVQNVNFTGAYVTANSSYNGVLAGRIRGRTYNDNVVIENVYLNGTVRMPNYAGSTSYFGGLTGYADKTNLSNIVSDVYVELNAYYSVDSVGGIAGYFSYGDAKNIYANGDIYIYDPSNESASYAKNYTGGVFGYSVGNASFVNRFENIKATGYVNVTERYAFNYINYTGGVIGYLTGLHKIDNVDADNLYVLAEGQLSYDDTSYPNYIRWTGGIIGQATTGSNSSSYSMNNFIAKNNVKISWNTSSGVDYMPSGIGYMNMYMTNGYASNSYLGTLNPTATPTYMSAIGYIGYTYSNIFYWDQMGYQYSLKTSYSNGSKTKSQLQTKSTYTGFDFTNRWAIQDGSTYPYLKTTPEFVRPLNPSYGQDINNPIVTFTWGNTNLTQNNKHVGYKLVLEKNNSGTWVQADTEIVLNNAATSAQMTIPAGTSAGTEFRWKVITLIEGNESGYVELNHSSYRYFDYTNNQTTLTTTFSANNNLNLSYNKRFYDFSIDNVKDTDSFNYVILYADVLNSSGAVISGSKQKIVLDADLTNNASYLISTAGEKQGALQGSFDHKTKMSFQLKLEPDLANRKFDLTLVKTDGLTEVVKAKLINDRPMQLKTDGAAEKFTLRIYAEDYQNAALPSAGALSTSALHTKQVNIDTRNYLPVVKNSTDDVNGRILSENEGYNKITVYGEVEDKDLGDNVTVYYEVQPKAPLYNISITGNVPNNGAKVKDFTPGPAGVDGSFEFTYQMSPTLPTNDYSLLVYGVDTQGGIGDMYVIPFRLERDGPYINFVSEYQQTDGDKITMSTAERQIIAEDSKIKLYFTPTHYATFEYAGYLIRGTQVYDLSLRGAFTSDVKSTFIGIDIGQTASLIGGTTMDYQLDDRILFKFKATSATGGVVEKDVRILIGNDASTFEPLSDINMPTF